MRRLQATHAGAINQGGVQMCLRQAEFLSKRGEYYWRHGNYGTIERSFLAVAAQIRYRSCNPVFGNCSGMSEWYPSFLPSWCHPTTRYGVIRGVEPNTCIVVFWSP